MDRQHTWNESMESFLWEDDEQSTRPNYAALHSGIAPTLPQGSPSLHTAGVSDMAYPMMNGPYLHAQRSHQPVLINSSTESTLPLPPSSDYSTFRSLSSTNTTVYDSMNNSLNPSLANSPHTNHHLLYQPSTLPSVVASKKRKLEHQVDTPARPPPALLGRSSRTGVLLPTFDPAYVPVPPLGLFGNVQHRYTPVSRILQDYGKDCGNPGRLQYARRASTPKSIADGQESLSCPRSESLRRVRSPSSSDLRPDFSTSSTAVSTMKVANTEHIKSSTRKDKIATIATSPGGTLTPYDADDPELHQLDFEPDLQGFGVDALYFMTIADRKKAQSRGFKKALDVYRERLQRPNIETSDINLAWIPGPGTHDGRFPWQPICGPAAYIAAIRGDLKLEYTPPETLYMQGKEYKAGEAISIPMLHNIVNCLWSKTDHGKTSYGHPRTKPSNRGDYMTFFPSQSDWSPSNLPSSAAILEPLKVGKMNVPVFKDRDGNDVLDANGQPHRAFDHILPAHMPSLVDGWLVAAWVSEDPRLQWKDIEANMSLRDKDAARLGDRYAKYRDGLPAMARTIKSNRSSKTDLKTVKWHGHENLAGNSWWYADLEKGLMCQFKDPMTALEEGLPAYPLPLRRKKDHQYSDRMVVAQETLKSEDVGAKEAEEEERSA